MSRKIRHLLSSDWFGAATIPPLTWELSQDRNDYHFAASRSASAHIHPDSTEGVFQAELWHYEVAEIFFADADGNHYLEVNLAPNGAWWACRFAQIRQAERLQPDFQNVRTSATLTASGWQASIRLPANLLRDFGSPRFNVTAILGQEKQQFLSHFPLPGKEPDFHQPEAFQPIPWRKDS
jgi:hypothetical protein